MIRPEMTILSLIALMSAVGTSVNSSVPAESTYNQVEKSPARIGLMVPAEARTVFTIDNLEAIAPKSIDQFNYVSKSSSDGFLHMLNAFREKDLDPQRVMAGIDFQAKSSHTPTKTVREVHWSPIECFHYDFVFRRRLYPVQELTRDANSRVLVMEDRRTKRRYILKVFATDEKYTAELGGLGRLKGPFFVNPICTMDVRLPVKIGSPHDHSDYEQVDFKALPPYKYVTRPAILMEYIEGSMHADEYAYKLGLEAGFDSEKSRPAFEKIAHLLAELFTAIIEIHANGLVYHDLKPENILVRKEGHVVMIDFDSMSPRTKPYSGTVTTSAPELWKFIQGPLHNAVDFWSFGVTAAILLANVCAGMYKMVDEKMSELFRHYNPLSLNQHFTQYTVNPLPTILHQHTREFLYPFFSPDPDSRRFNTVELQNMIRSMPFFQYVNWDIIKEPNIDSPYHQMTQDEIRAHLLENADRKVSPYDEYCQRRRAQFLYRPDDMVMVTDTEASERTGEIQFKAVKVRSLLVPVAAACA